MKQLFFSGDQRAIRKFSQAALLVTALVCHFAGGVTAAVGVPVAGLGVLLLLFSRIPFPFRPSKTSDRAAASGREPLLPHLAQKEVDESIAIIAVDALGAPFRKKQWEQTEKDVDALIDECIRLIKMRINVHSVAIFFQTIGNGYKMRRYWSQSEHIFPDAELKPGLGVLGALFKQGLKTLNLHEILTDSTTLYYYRKDAGVRSLIACPIVAGNAERGIVVVDSTEKGAFTDEHVAFVSTAAAILGQAAYNANLRTVHALDHDRLSTVSTIEKMFFQHPSSVDSILDIVANIIPFAFSCDRMTISMRSEDGEHATIMRTHGADADRLRLKQFSLAGNSLAKIIYSKNSYLSRNFTANRYEIRHFEKEPENDDFMSFLAVPIGVEDCRGMILLESTAPDAFSDADRTLLSHIARSAGLAIVKVVVLEKANNLATHDGLTGLFNHRQFQIKLRDEIVRSKRQEYPLALVIGDIDFFKKINDTYGHPFGDTVLKNVASLLESSIRQEIDTAARYGGEEFALILVETDEAQARESAERIRANIEKSTVRHPQKGDVRVSMSFGIAILGKHATELNELIKKADKALYRAKEQGRNRVEVF
jgi:diguanylate cyclase (GGDEF)-like protein